MGLLLHHFRQIFGSVFSLSVGICIVFSSCHSSAPKHARLTELQPKTRPVQLSIPKKDIVRFKSTDFLTYDELVLLSKNPELNTFNHRRLEHFFSTPIISNEAYFQGLRPQVKETATLGEILRVATWNIEKSLNVTEVAQALSSEKAFLQMLDQKRLKVDSPQFKEALRQRERLASADVIFLQEMDIGVSRSDYLDAARFLAKKLKMNYAYAPQALEVDPILLGTENLSNKESYLLPDKKRYKGVFGSAILSKYPILSAEVTPLKHQPYDWYHQELLSADLVEKGRRLGSAIVFENIISRELKIGGRHFFRVDIAVPQAPHGKVSLINNHLEIKTLPKDREKQMVEILSKVQAIKNPVIMAGDHNSAPNDVSATSLHRVMVRMVDNPTSLLTTVSSLSDAMTGTVIPFYRERGIINSLKNFQNPLAYHVPVIFPNPVLGMFKQVEKHRFEDGSAFDFRGDSKRTINGKIGILSNSNERQLYGHQPTFSLRRPIGPIGRYKLDWIFVKSGELTHPNSKGQSYRFAPHFGETLEMINDSVMRPFSDHHPIVVDLPFQEPKDR